ncbi:hypothetical protein [Nocardia sp. NPDC049149]|uniref:hypothetical protein n=1 Tax=Nocardia sp. NPDC049149 TaxID=3364315 RepID=UPI0037170895
MSDGYSQDRDQVPNHERGKNFESGTGRFFRDRENGYTPGSRKYEFRDKDGRTERIQFDKIRNEQVPGRTDSIEEKSGRIEGRKDEKQLRGIRELLDRGEINHHILRSVEGESISKECRELIDGLKRDFPDRFTHLEISRADARAIWAIGRDLEQSRQRGKEPQGVQLELPGVAAKAREQKGVDLQKRRDKIATIAKAREKAVSLEKVGKFKDGAAKGRAESQAKAEREAPAREVSDADRAKAEREAARKAALEFPPPGELGKGRADSNQVVERAQGREVPETAQDRASREAADRIAPEFLAVLRGQNVSDTTERGAREAVDAAGREAADKAREAAAQQREADAARAAEAVREAREAAAQERAKALRESQMQGISPEVQRLLALGQAQAPEAAVRTPPGHAPSVERGGRDGRDGRGIERTR